MNEFRDRIFRIAKSVTNEMLVITWHIRNFVRSSVCKCIDLSNTLYSPKTYNVLFYYPLRPDTLHMSHRTHVMLFLLYK
jgi:hypothetical protein